MQFYNKLIHFVYEKVRKSCMFLYTNNYKSEILTKSEPLEENYYASITSAQLTFCELMTECTVKYYRDLYHANKDPKIVTEANEGFFSKILGYLKKFRDMIVGFFRKWYKKLVNKIGDFLEKVFEINCKG